MKIHVFDTETASLTKGICDIAIVQIDESFNVLWEVESLIDPECEISPQAMGVHHITEEMVQFAPTIEEFMSMHNYPFRDADVFCGHNVPFDLRFTAPYLPEMYKKIDTLKLARQAWPDAEDHKLQTLRYKFKLDAGTAHRAMGDVVATINLMKLLAEVFDTNLEGLIALNSAPLSLETRISFGKHKGAKLKDIPLTWVRWLLEKADNVDPDLREALSARL